MRKSLAAIFAAACVLSAGCATEGDESPGTTLTMTKEQARELKGKSDEHRDLCTLLGWYDDGICDDFCPAPDPDCGQSTCGGFAGWTCSDTEWCDYPEDSTCGAADQLGIFFFID